MMPVTQFVGSRAANITMSLLPLLYPSKLPSPLPQIMSALTATRPRLPSVNTQQTIQPAQRPAEEPQPEAGPSTSRTPLDTTITSLATDASTIGSDSPISCYSSLPSLTHSSPSSSSSSLHSAPERVNEHLAVFLPKHLWKPDSLAHKCDNFYCQMQFNVLQRRHHCRKCGGIFCASCSGHFTPLLDTSNLEFLHPPRHTSISQWESPESPILNSRVCDDCWDFLHGQPSSPRTPEVQRPSFSRLLSSPIAMLKSPLSASPVQSAGSSLCSSVEAPSTLQNIIEDSTSALLATAAPLARKARGLRPATSSSSLDSHSRPSSKARVAPRAGRLTLPAEIENKSYGELDAYPLRHSSVLCKATGGGRWQPKQEPQLVGYRPPIPGAKAQYEIEMEEEERETRRRMVNPVVHDREFRYRFGSDEAQPSMLSRTPSLRSTF